jgi:hypothetical protein
MGQKDPFTRDLVLTEVTLLIAEAGRSTARR